MGTQDRVLHPQDSASIGSCGIEAFPVENSLEYKWTNAVQTRGCSRVNCILPSWGWMNQFLWCVHGCEGENKSFFQSRALLWEAVWAYLEMAEWFGLYQINDGTV